MMQTYNGSQDLHEFDHLVMGDISGIQDFIFNVKSEGAAKTLKGRSFFVGAIAELCLDLIEEYSKEGNNLLFYNGGGSFYVLCKTLPEIDKIRAVIQRDLADMELYLTITDCEFDPNKFGQIWRSIHQKSNREKLRKFSSHFGAFAAAANRPETAVDQAESNTKVAWDWKGLVGRFKEIESYEIIRNFKERPGKRVYSSQLIALGRAWKIKGDTKITNLVLTALPRWINIWDNEEIKKYREKLLEREQKKDPKYEITKDDVLEFETLAHQAYIRTGTDKLGVLKMDVDFLGDAFQKAQKLNEAAKLSADMQAFFGNDLYSFWEGSSFQLPEGELVPFKNNIYILFAGGDDCMFIGGWDAIFEFAFQLRKTFSDFVSKKNYKLSISGAIIVVDGKFPVVRFGELAEQAIKTAKKEVPEEKDRISVFGKILKWNEFESARVIAHELYSLYKKDKLKRRIIHRIQMSHLGYEKIQEKALNDGVIRNPEVWRLFYFIREYKEEAFEYLQKTLEVYQKALLAAITHKKRLNAAAMTPVAARWAEFLTKQKSKEK